VKKIRVLIVDDSPFFRQTIATAISSDPLIEIVAVASNPSEARDRIVETNPDVITCDVEMPVMNGIEFLRWLLPQHFVPVIMVSSVSDKVFDAMNAGAVDFVVKPDQHSFQNPETFGSDLIRKIKTASTVKLGSLKAQHTAGSIPQGQVKDSSDRIIVIGASTGGTEAIFNILKVLPNTVPGIAIVQHIPPIFSKMFAERLNDQTALTVKEAETGLWPGRGNVVIAPGDMHMKIKKVGGIFQIECFRGEKINGHCPSVDVLFESAARDAGNRVIGILLTGMGYDGAKGLLNIRRKGGRTIGQDETSSIVYGMPKVAQGIGAVEIQASLIDIPKILMNLLE